MQTFLPCPDFALSMIYLDFRRLGKQRVEGMQLVDALTIGTRWKNHPAAKMWANNIPALKLYTNIAIQTWIAKGYKNTMKLYEIEEKVIMPSWLGREDFHDSHRSNLLRKDPVFYGNYGWTEPTDLPYVWPLPE